MAAAAQASQAKAPAAMQAMAPPPVFMRAARSGFIPPLASLAAIPARPAVQRTCEACGEEESEEGSSVQPRLEVGPVGDRFEVEADAIAAQVMAMRDSEATAAAPAVQRACAACASDDEPRARRTPLAKEEMDEEGPVRARRTEPDGAGETIGASHSELTRGGNPLPPATLDFFEQRLGRDLADVRIHQGGGARELNRSIGARAFTFRNHIWLGSGESVGPSFTMAHELAHVMQQTAPGPVGPARARRRLEASGAGPALQRKDSSFFLPGRTTIGGKTKALHTAMHDRAIGAMVKENPGMKSEVAIPGATRNLVQTDKCGFADLYFADKDNVPGVKVIDGQPPAAAATPPADPGAAPPAGPPGSPNPATPSAPSAPAAPPPAATPPTRLESFPGKPEQSCEPLIADKYDRAPRLDNGRLVGLDRTPTKILIGEMKPFHDEGYRAEGKVQVDNYIRGLKITIAAVNRMAEADPAQSHRWNAVPELLTDPKLPLGWTTEGVAQSGWPVRNLKIRGYDEVTKTAVKGKNPGKTYTGQQAKDLRPPVEITGKWMVAKDSNPANSGVFLYFLAPNPDEFKAALAHGSTSAEFKALATGIAAIQAPLIAPPHVDKVDKTGKAKPRRLPGASRASPVVRRNARDDFKASLWEAKRRGNAAHPKESEDNLLSRYDSVVSPEMAEAISERAGMLDWLRDKPATPGLVYEAPPTARGDEIRGDMTLLKKLDFWTGLKARPFGILREKFGKAFVWVFRKVADFRERLHKRFSEKKEDDFLAGRKGTILKAAAKVAAIVLPRVVAPFMRTMYNTIVDCAVEGFKAKMKALIEGSFIDDLILMAEEMKGKVDRAIEGVEAYLKDLVDKTIKPIQEEFQKFIEEMQFLLQVAGVIQEIAKAARVGSCVAGLIAAPETVGIGAVVGCGAALGDYILSKFGLSPIEYLVAMTLESCESQNTIGRAISQMDFLRSLSRRAGVKVVEEVKAVLADNFRDEFGGKTYGQHASELFCDPNSIDFPTPEFEPSDCRKTPRHRRSKTGSYEVPDSVPRYDPLNPNNDPEEEARWQGRDGRPPPKPGTASAQAPPAAGSPGGRPPLPPKPPGTGGGQGGGEPREHGVEDGTVDPAKSKNVTVNWAVYEGFAYGTFDPPLRRDVLIGATDSDGDQYGPDLVACLIHEVYPKGKQPMVKIEFARNQRLTSNGARLGLIQGQIREMPVRGPLGAPEPAAGGAGK